ncbi:hypothetical protein [Thermomonas fusca]
MRRRDAIVDPRVQRCRIQLDAIHQRHHRGLRALVSFRCHLSDGGQLAPHAFGRDRCQGLCGSRCAFLILQLLFQPLPCGFQILDSTQCRGGLIHLRGHVQHLLHLLGHVDDLSAQSPDLRRIRRAGQRLPRAAHQRDGELRRRQVGQHLFQHRLIDPRLGDRRRRLARQAIAICLRPPLSTVGGDQASAK